LSNTFQHIVKFRSTLWNIIAPGGGAPFSGVGLITTKFTVKILNIFGKIFMKEFKSLQGVYSPTTPDLATTAKIYLFNSTYCSSTSVL